LLEAIAALAVSRKSDGRIQLPSVGQLPADDIGSDKLRRGLLAGSWSKCRPFYALRPKRFIDRRMQISSQFRRRLNHLAI
jgi:hypothetical protein